MPVALAIVAVASVASAAASVYSGREQQIASNKQADAARQAADYNAKLDVANAQQLAMDSAANIQRQRSGNQAYLSKQLVAYAASGILSDTGSPLAVQATTAGRMEQDIQQYWTSVQQKESSLYASAQEGRYEGEETADIYHLQGTAALVSGIGRAVGTLGQAASYFG